MLAIIPLIFFVVSFFALYGIKQSADLKPSDWRGTFLQTCLLWGALTTILTELLSLFGLLSLPWLAILWTLALVVVIFLCWRQDAFVKAWVAIKQLPWTSISWIDALLIVALIFIVGTLFAIAWHSPPNNTDSLQYHMSRVVHWAQNKSLRHYPTYYEPQLWSPVWSEMAILNLRILWGNDQMASLVQWFCMLGSLVGVSALAGLLGASRRGQFVAAAFVVSIPSGILQATGTKNDCVTAFWLVCLMYFVLLSKKRKLDRSEWLSLALATGLGMLTKGTFYPFALPILLWFFIPALAKRGLRWTLANGLGLAAIVLILNAGYWGRNFNTYGNPLGSRKYVTQRTNMQLNPKVWISGVVEDAALNLNLSESMRARVYSAVVSFDGLLGISPDDFNLISSWNHEDLAGNPLHLLSMPIAFIALLLGWRQERFRISLLYALIVVVSFIVYSIVVGFDVYGARLQLPVFVLWGAVIGVVASLPWFRKLAYPAVILILMTAIPYLVLNRSRPLVDWRPRTMTESIFDEPATAILFANWVSLRGPSIEAAEAVKELGCMQVGLQIDSHDLEYPYWWLLDAPQSGIMIEVVDTYPHLERYLDQDFKPCAIICTVCGGVEGKERLYGLPLKSIFDVDDELISVQDIRLFAGSSYVPFEDG